MPFDWDEGGNVVTFSDMVFNHDINEIWNPHSEVRISLYFERVQWDKETVN